MKKEGYYSSGEFAKKAHVTLRTIRYYDKQNILVPSARTESGARLYTDEDLAKLQQILLLKYLGFSLEDIREITLASADQQYLLESLRVQKKLLQERIEKMQAMTEAIDSTMGAIRKEQTIDWNSMLDLMHMTAMEHSLKSQYQNAANISARIRLHRDYSVNKEGWFPWIMRQCAPTPGMRILEIGCGNGALWTENLSVLPSDIQVVLSDRSEGMLRDAQNALGEDSRFFYQKFDCHQIPFSEESFDLVIANHILFYCGDISQVLSECRRVLRSNGRMVCSTYGRQHMKEITELVQKFNREIVLSADVLYERFGLENGGEQLQQFFTDVKLFRYEDAIEISEAEPLISYILSCHGNQNQLLLDRYKEFREFVEVQVAGGFHITKDAGLFLCTDN
ncbi:MAG: methyltransferase domain-containing protein [Lachnospiraceae bacterium]|nr:MerR family transcriptional regulator [Agathobacter sp.]MDD6444808.1 methyltransferase domain-containing protein [Lachnospiraceae bacterium]